MSAEMSGRGDHWP